MNHLIEGLDPTGLDCISVSQLLQMIRAAKPAADQGWLIFGSSAPDVVTNPELARFFWIETVDDVDYIPVSPFAFYYYNGTSWQSIPLIDGSLLADASVTLAKLATTGASADDIIQVKNVGGSLLLNFVTLANALVNDSITPIKLKAPDAINSYVLTCLAGVKAFSTFAAFLAALANNSIPLNKLAFGAANTFLRMNPTADGVQFTTADIADILAAGYTAGQSVRRNAGNTGWEGFTPATGGISSGSPAMQALPSGVGTLTFTSPLASFKLFQVSLYCETDEYGFVAGDEIPITAVSHYDGSAQHWPIGVTWKDLVVRVDFWVAGLFVTSVGSGGVFLTRANWKVKVTFYA